jgi:Ni,Fe-hydrogenase III large subunit
MKMNLSALSLLLIMICAAINASAADTTNEVAALKAEVERLKGLVPDQSHAMKDVGYHFANLWFAAERKNWPLADFYASETKSHLRWAVRIIPVRKDAQGNQIRLSEILDPIEKTSFKEVQDSIQAKDPEHFTRAYKQMMESCYACHLAASKPYLRLQIPKQPEAPIINFDPAP